ncbi:MAG: carboxypeptidase regulatory-like domain-containing protein [bacterium]
MKKLFIISCLLFLVGIVPALAEGFIPVYWIAGKVGGVPAGTKVYFYKDAIDLANPATFTLGVTDADGNYRLNAFGPDQNFMVVGATHHVVTEPVGGAPIGPVAFTISGNGFDVVNLGGGGGTIILATITDSKTGDAVKDASVLVAGKPVVKTDDAGVASIDVDAGTYQVDVSKDSYIPNSASVTVAGGETKAVALAIEASTPPVIGSVKFGNRLYQPVLVARGDPFVVSPNPVINANITNVPSSGIKSSSVSLTVDGGTATAKKYEVAELSLSVLKSQNVSGVDRVSEMAIKLEIPEASKMAEGSHLIEFTASNDYGISTVYTATVEVLGGPLRIIGTPITFPSPFASLTQKTCYIQYILSKDANIEIYIADVTGQRVKRYVLSAGTEGGSAGVNKISWDGMTDQGYMAGNAIYVGVIVAKDENKLLEKFKLTIVN